MPVPPHIRSLPLLLALLAVLLAFLGQYQFANSSDPPVAAVVAFVLAAVCLLVAERLLAVRRDQPPPPAPTRDQAAPVPVRPATVLREVPVQHPSAAPHANTADARSPAVTQAGRRAILLRLLTSLALAVGAQALVAGGLVSLGILGYAVAVAFAVAGTLPIVRGGALATQPVRWAWSSRQLGLALMALTAGAGTFALSGGNRYRLAGVLLWGASILGWWLAWGTFKRPAWSPRKLRAHWPVLALLAAVLLLGAAFRFVNLYGNPLEMGSDHAEKLLDVHDVLNGTPYIFFERNTGREPWQFYWTVLLIKLFNLPPDFMALKIGTALIGWLMLPAIFLLAREVFGTRVALLATLFAAVAGWAVIPARFGLRYPLAPCAAAWTLYFAVRGLRRNERNALLAAGLWMGIGLQGYTAYRFMPVVVGLLGGLVVVGHGVRRRRALALQTLVNGGLALVMAVLVLMPLLRYGFDQPDSLLYRMTSRLTDQERAIQGAVVAIFADNLKNVLLFFNYTSDVVPVVNIPGKPAMDSVLGALLVIGAAATITLSVKTRDFWPAALLGAGILMLFPSALSIAYPGENPSIVRTGSAIPMLLTVCAVVPGIVVELARRYEQPLLRRASVACVAVLVAVVVGLNADRVFRQYPEQYCAVGRNASDIARELQAFVAAGHAREHAWIVGYPHWVDYRAVGIWIGDITFANEIFGAEEVAQVDLNGQPGWFALHVDDTASLQVLREKYPYGTARTVVGAQCPDEKFVVFTVP